jgi:tetratricopeptide (TPR) repeat protein
MKKVLIISSLFFVTFAVSAQDYQSYINETDVAYFEKNYDKAVECFQVALNLQGDIPFYNAACVAALAGKTDLAFEWLNFAFNKGFYDVRQLQKDNDLLSLHNNPKWQDLVEKMQKEIDKIESNYDKQLQEKLLTIFDNDQDIRQKYIFMHAMNLVTKVFEPTVWQK